MDLSSNPGKETVASILLPLFQEDVEKAAVSDREDQNH